MARSANSSSDDNFAYSQEEINSEESSNLVFSEDEERLIIRMYNLVGERWSLIAGRIPGRTAEEIEKYWMSRSCQVNDTKRFGLGLERLL